MFYDILFKAISDSFILYLSSGEKLQMAGGTVFTALSPKVIEAFTYSRGQNMEFTNQIIDRW